jgi:hypothetical protein
LGQKGGVCGAAVVGMEMRQRKPRAITIPRSTTLVALEAAKPGARADVRPALVLLDLVDEIEKALR